MSSDQEKISESGDGRGSDRGIGESRRAKEAWVELQPTRAAGASAKR